MGPPATTTHRVEAYNTATASQNKIHDDEVAQRFGFAGGLVPGVDVFAYLVHPVVERWGLDWFSGGSIGARFLSPVYDGESVTIEATDAGPDGLRLSLVGPDGAERATGTAHAPDAPVDDRPTLPVAELPADPPPPTATSLAPGTVLGTIVEPFDAERARRYLTDVRETSALYLDEGLAHPGWLLRQANHVLACSVTLGPWIHAGSELTMLHPVRDGDIVSTRARTRTFTERKGHELAALDVELVVRGRVVMRVDHTTITRPRQTPET